MYYALRASGVQTKVVRELAPDAIINIRTQCLVLNRVMIVA